MATAPLLENLPAENAQSASTNIATIVAQTPAVVLVNKDQRKSLYEHIEREIADFVPDVTTKKGRDAIKALAFKITKTKTAIDAAGKTLNEEARAKINIVDEARRDARNTLDILADRVRQPLTEWEDAEKARIERAETIIGGIREMGKVTVDDTAEMVRERGSIVFNMTFDPAEFGELLADAEAFKTAAIDTLKTALARLTKEEADRAELEKLRAEKAEAERIAAEKAEAEEAERQRAEAERIAEERRIAAEQAEADRIKRVREEAAAQAQRDAEKAAQAERDKVQREHEAQLAKERAEAQAERDRIARGREMLAYIREVVAGRIGGQAYPFAILLRELETKVVVVGEGYGDMEAEIEQARIDGLANLNAAMERQAERHRQEEERVAAEAKAKEAQERAENKAHRTRVKTAAKQAIMTCGVSEEAAQKIVLAIIAGEVPSVRLEF